MSSFPHQDISNRHHFLQSHFQQIHPTFLSISNQKQESEERKRRRHDSIYDNAQETSDVEIGDRGIITFTKHFQYLGGYISYFLRDDHDVDERISQAFSAMGALNHFWSDIAVDNYSKYLIFRAIPINLLLWGCESWALRETTLRKLEVFLHRSIRKILRIDITQVIDERFTNGSIRNRFFSILTIRNQITQRQLTFIGKVVRNKDNQLPTQLMTAWCNNKRKRGAPLQKNKKNLAQNIRLLIPGAEKDGLLTSWVYFVLDDGHWKYLISLLGNKPTKWSGPEPDADSPFPPAHRVSRTATRRLPALRPVIDLSPPPPPLITTDQLRRPHLHPGERVRLPPETLGLEIMATLAIMNTTPTG